jgi:hypothetical protein
MGKNLFLEIGNFYIPDFATDVLKILKWDIRIDIVTEELEHRRFMVNEIHLIGCVGVAPPLYFKSYV